MLQLGRLERLKVLLEKAFTSIQEEDYLISGLGELEEALDLLEELMK